MRLFLVFAACFAGGFCPLVNADAVLVAAALLTNGGSAVALISVAALAQVGGKLVLFALLRRGASRARQWLRVRAAEPPAALTPGWRTALLSRLPLSGAAAVTISAATGVPPFFAITFTAAAGRISATRFCAAALAGRTLRVAGIVLIPRLLTGG